MTFSREIEEADLETGAVVVTGVVEIEEVAVAREVAEDKVEEVVDLAVVVEAAEAEEPVAVEEEEIN